MFFRLYFKFNILNSSGVTPLQYAAANRVTDVPALLLSRGASYRPKNMYANWRLQQQLGCHQLVPQAALPWWGEEGGGERGGRAMGGIMQGMQMEQWR